jgi:hypothetical protein
MSPAHRPSARKVRATSRTPAAAPSPLDRLRAFCLSLPEATEVEAWGAPTFRVKGRIFAMYAAPNQHHGDGRPATWLHCAAENQRALIASDPSRYFSPPYVGPKGWVGVWIDRRPRWREVEELVRDAWCRVAPKKLLRSLLDGIDTTTVRDGDRD